MTFLITPPRFAIGFGLTGLAGAWDAAADALQAPRVVGPVIAAIAALVLVALVAMYLAERRATGEIARDLQHPVFFPFFALPLVSAELLVARFGVASPAPVALVVAVLASAGGVLGIVHLVRVMRGLIAPEHMHGGQLVPTVAGTLVPSWVFARLGFEAVSAGLLAVGLVLAVVFTVLVATAAIGGAAIPPALRPTLAILVAPPAIAGSIVLELGAAAPIVAGLAGLTVAAVGLQVGLIPVYRRGGFSPAWWAFTFPAAAAVIFELRSAAVGSASAVLLGWVSLSLLTVGVILIAAFTVRAETAAALSSSPGVVASR